MSTTTSAVLLENGSETGGGVYFPGGTATVEIIANFGIGNVAVEKLGADGVTWLSVVSSQAANILFRPASSLSYPPGQYRAVVAAGATGVYVKMERVPS